MWLLNCAILCLLPWQVWTQAPGDFNEECRAGQNEGLHIFPDTLELLLDSYDYSNLINTQGLLPAWLTRDYDSSDPSIGWEQVLGGPCTQTPSVNTQTLNFENEQDNWIFTQYVSYREAVEVIFNVTYNLAQCIAAPACTTRYFTLYRFDTEMLPSNDRDIVDTENYVPLFGTLENSRLEPTSTSSSSSFNQILYLNRPSATGFYLGIQDTGSAGSLGRILVHYLVARGRTEDLLTCPDVPLPPQDGTATNTELCSCEENASPVTSLSRTCTASGVCNEDQVCACSEGHELSGGNCVVCVENTYKAGVSNNSCQACPANSESRGEGNTICDCIPPNTRNPANPDDPCTTPPSSPRLILGGGGAPRVSDNRTSISVCWLPSLDSGGIPETLHYNIYLYDTAVNVSLFEKVNSEPIIDATMDNMTRICYEVPINDPETSYGVVVVASNGATVDPDNFTDVAGVQDRFVVFFVALGDLSDPTTVESPTCEVVIVEPPTCEVVMVESPTCMTSIVATLFGTLIPTAVITAVVVFLVVWCCLKNKNASSASSSYPSKPAPSQVKYHASGSYDNKNEYIDSGVSSPVTATSPVPVKPRPPVPQARPAPAGPGRKPPPRPPNKPAQA